MMAEIWAIQESFDRMIEETDRILNPRGLSSTLTRPEARSWPPRPQTASDASPGLSGALRGH
jgi:hypothetical protein